MKCNWFSVVLNVKEANTRATILVCIRPDSHHT